MTFNNVNNNPWHWFSGQHEVGLENNCAGPLTLFDNNDTRISKPPLGLGGGNRRGRALNVDESVVQVTPVLSADLGVYSAAGGSTSGCRAWQARVCIGFRTRRIHRLREK